jgi:DNA (cytosine-5)-methyltransferase 1
MNHLDLCSGIGGWGLAARWAGLNTVGFAEIEPYACKVLAKQFPNITNYGDITKLDYEKIKEISIVTASLPCQPFSVAGKRGGKSDDRYLWDAYFEVIENIKPTWTVCENVTGLVSMGIEDLLSKMESQGYKIQTFIIPASGVGAPHRRDRVWIIAYSNSSRGRNSESRPCDGRAKAESKTVQQVDGSPHAGNSQSVCKAVSDSNSIRLARRSNEGCGMGGPSSNSPEIRWESQPTVGRGNHGISSRLDRLRCLGNAIVPQVAYQILRSIKISDDC